MVDTIYFDRINSELDDLYDVSFRVSFQLSEEEWNFSCFTDAVKAMDFLRGKLPDFACVDVCGESGLELAKTVRTDNPSSLILIIASPEISPVKYLNPTVMPSSLLLRPFTKNQAKSVILDVFNLLIANKNRENEDVFQFDYKGAKKVIPYSSIYYFEAREKKVYINVGNTEYSIYDTVDSLEKKLTKGFIRTHRGFLVSKNKIDSVYLSRNTIELINGVEVPLSRSFKPYLKELK